MVFVWLPVLNHQIPKVDDNYEKATYPSYLKLINYNSLDSNLQGHNYNYGSRELLIDSIKTSIYLNDSVTNSVVINNYYTNDKESRITYKEWILLFIGMLVGFLTSMYGSIIFQRWTRFKSLIRETAILRLNFTGYPIELKDLPQSVTKSFDYYQKIENIRLSLDADGHKDAAKELSKLSSFIYISMYKMAYVSDQNLAKKSHSSLLLTAFQSEFNRIVDKEFKRFEEQLKPNWISILRIGPHPILPEGQTQAGVRYYENLGF